MRKWKPPLGAGHFGSDDRHDRTETQPTWFNAPKGKYGESRRTPMYICIYIYRVTAAAKDLRGDPDGSGKHGTECTALEVRRVRPLQAARDTGQRVVYPRGPKSCFGSTVRVYYDPRGADPCSIQGA
jgi:hypothetical protein